MNTSLSVWRSRLTEKIEDRRLEIECFWYKPSSQVGGINLKDATHSRFPRRYRQSQIFSAIYNCLTVGTG